MLTKKKTVRVLMPNQWITPAAYPFTVLHHSSNVLEVLKVLRVHRTKLCDFITNSEALWKQTTNYYNHSNQIATLQVLNFKEL